MSRLTRDGTAEPVSRDQILRHARGQGNIIFPVQLTTSRIGNLTRLTHTLLYVMTIHTYIHTYILTLIIFVGNNDYHHRSILWVPPAGGCIFFAENDLPGGNPKVGGGDLKIHTHTHTHTHPWGKSPPGGSSEKHNNTHISHTPQLPRCRV